jgi:hypothetical protein
MLRRVTAAVVVGSSVPRRVPFRRKPLRSASPVALSRASLVRIEEREGSAPDARVWKKSHPSHSRMSL